MEHSEANAIVTFEFDPDYEVEIDPEFPPAGVWPFDEISFGQDGRVVDALESRWGAPRAITVHPARASPWVGFFPNGGLGGADGVFAMPGRSDLCVAVGGTAYVVDVDHPQSGATVASVNARQIVASAEPSLLLFSTSSEIIAFGAHGKAWESPRLVLDDLRITGADGGTIRAQGSNVELEQFELDARTGRSIE